MVQLYVILPVGGGAQIDNSLPGGQGGYPSQPIYHPGHPDHGLPAHPDQGLPGGGQSGGHPSHPIHIPGVPDQGLPPGQPVTINPPPPPPAGHENELVIAVWNDGAWTVTAYDTDASAGQPLPETPQPKGRHR
jgi:hypothetical protein